MSRIPKKLLNNTETLEQLVEFMTTDKDGNKLNIGGIGKTNDFILRYEMYKEYLKENIPELTFEEILKFHDLFHKFTEHVCGWSGFENYLTCLEFEIEKNKL